MRTLHMLHELLELREEDIFAERAVFRLVVGGFHFESIIFQKSFPRNVLTASS